MPYLRSKARGMASRGTSTRAGCGKDGSGVGSGARLRIWVELGRLTCCPWRGLPLRQSCPLCRRPNRACGHRWPVTTRQRLGLGLGLACGQRPWSRRVQRAAEPSAGITHVLCGRMHVPSACIIYMCRLHAPSACAICMCHLHVPSTCAVCMCHLHVPSACAIWLLGWGGSK